MYFCWNCLNIIKGYEHFSLYPECWDTSGDVVIKELSNNEFEEVKESLGDQDMHNSIVCPHCLKITKKKTESNYLC